MPEFYLLEFKNLKCIATFLIAVALLVVQAQIVPAKAEVDLSVQQQITVTGTVVDETGAAMPGVGVEVRGTGTWAITTSDGTFRVVVPNANAVLSFSFLGYVTQEVTVGTQRNLSIMLEPDSAVIEPLIVVGYGTQRKATLTGSVSAIGSEELNLTKNVNTQNMLTGKLPGLRVIQKTSEPGQFNNQFDIRGMGNPLFVVDGVPRGDFPRMEGLDIENISILKDASAAIYGVRAGNGVVLITTKTGAKQKASISYSGSYGMQFPADLLVPLNSRDRAILYNEITMRDYNNPQRTYDDNFFDELAKGERNDTNWYNEVLRNMAPEHKHNLTISGGGETVNYYVGLGYNKQDSFWKTNSTNYDRYNARVNLDFRVVNNLTASVRLSYMTDRRNAQNEDAWGLFKQLWRSIPTDPVYANTEPPYNESPYFFNVTSGDIKNPVPLIMPELSGYKQWKKDLLNSSISLKYDFPFVKGLSTQFLFAYDKNFDDNTEYNKSYQEWTYNTSTQKAEPYTQNGRTTLRRSFGTGNTRMWNWNLNYVRTFAEKHNINILALYEETYSQGYDFYARRYFSIPIPYLFAGDSENQEGNGSGLSENANRGLVGRVNYDYAGKYLAEFAFRYDGSSKFPKGKQWGFFPSASIGWRISEESFIKDNVSWIDNIKLRASFGVVGDDSASSFQFIEGFDYPVSRDGDRMRAGGYVFGNTLVNGIGFRNAPNPNITWYTSTMKNIGLDVTLWRGMFGFSLDLFQRDRDGLLDTPSVVTPGTFGSGISQANLNADRQKGFELELTHENRVSRDFNYRVKGYVAMTRSMLTKKVQPQRQNSYDYWRNNQVGRYNDIWFGTEGAGVYQSMDEIINSMYSDNNTLPGDPYYKDWNGDGVIDGDDNHPIGTTVNPGSSHDGRRNFPLMTFAVELSAQYKWFDLSLHFQGSAMADVSYGEQLTNPLQWDGNALGILFDRWHPVDPKAHPWDPTTEWVSGRFPMGKTRASENSTFGIQDGSYIRLKNAELGFTVPDNAFFKKMNISNLRLYVNAFNLFTITKVIGIDPERPTELYGYMYPLNRTFTFGGSLTF